MTEFRLPASYYDPPDVVVRELEVSCGREGVEITTVDPVVMAAAAKMDLDAAAPGEMAQMLRRLVASSREWTVDQCPHVDTLEDVHVQGHEATWECPVCLGVHTIERDEA